jgi:hypothetical protein
LTQFNTKLTKRIPPTSGPDVVINNNDTFVVGISNTPINAGQTPPGPSTSGLILLLDPSGNFISWVGANTLLNSGFGAYLLNLLVTDHQGLVMFDQSGNDYYFQ